jgi:hypothetical protein
MSDLSFHERLKRRSHPAARWWRFGDVFYYVGLLVALLCAPAAALAVIAGREGLGWWWLAGAVAAFIASVGASCVGMSIKDRAYRMARRDGIDVTGY